MYSKARTFISSRNDPFFAEFARREGRGGQGGNFLDCITAMEKMYARIYFDGRGSPLCALLACHAGYEFSCSIVSAHVFPPSGAHILPKFAPSGALSDRFAVTRLPRQLRRASSPAPPPYRPWIQEDRLLDLFARRVRTLAGRGASEPALSAR